MDSFIKIFLLKMNKKQSNRVIYEFVYTLKIYSVCYMFFCGIIVLRFVGDCILVF